MKKTIAIITALILALALCACGEKTPATPAPTEAPQTEQSQNEATPATPGATASSSHTVEATDDGTNTTFEMPAGYFYDEVTGELVNLQQFAADNDLVSATYNEANGTVVLVMETNAYKEFIENIRAQLTETFSAMVEDTDYTTFLRSVNLGNNFESVTFYVDKDAFSKEFALYEVAPQAASFAGMYQDYLGWCGTGSSQVYFVAEGTDEVLGGMSFPEAWDLVNEYAAEHHTGEGLTQGEYETSGSIAQTEQPAG